MVKLGFIGVGFIASRVIEGMMLAASDNVESPVTNIILSPRKSTFKDQLISSSSSSSDYITVAESDTSLVNDVDWLAVCLPPKQELVIDILTKLPLKDNHVIILITSGVDINILKQHISCVNIIHCVPLPAAGMRKSVTIVSSPHEGVTNLFNTIGTTAVVENDDKAKILTTAACLMGPYYKLLGSITDTLVDKGIPRELSAAYVGDLFMCFSQEISGHENKHLDGNRFDRLVLEQTPGGLNESNIKYINDKHGFQLWQQAQENVLERMNKSRKQ